MPKKRSERSSMNIAIITGASSGMGYETALQLDRILQRTDELWLIARNTKKLKELKGRLRNNVRIIPMDLTDPDSFETFSQILEFAKPEEKEIVSGILKKKPTRTMSGVAIVAVMCHPHKCPHGRCFYCPESDIAPPSYTGEEPAALRGRMYEFHPYIQCFNRLKQLKKIGHPIDKVELIIMGGTFPSRDLCYQEWFVSQCLKAMTDFGLIIENKPTNYE